MIGLLPLAPVAGSQRPQPARITEYYGLCDASGAVAAGADRFLVASDEDSVLRLFSRQHSGGPEQLFDLGRLLALDPKHPETDLEAGTRLGDLVFWISSHGRSAKGKVRESRNRLFATRVEVQDGRVAVRLEGRPYRLLLDDLLQAPQLAPFGLAAASGRSPKEPGGLNIEGLCGTPDGRLWIGFRSPTPRGRALLVPLLNPCGVITGERAKLGAPMLLDLDGLGVRDLAWAEGRFLIVAGAPTHGGHGRLYWWGGGGASPERLNHTHLKGLHPEAVVFYPDLGTREFQIISDDGLRVVDGCPCKQLKDPGQQRFRSLWLRPRAGPPEEGGGAAKSPDAAP